MKKYFLIVVCLLVLLVTGCANKENKESEATPTPTPVPKNSVVCKGEYTESGITIKAEVEALFDNNDKLESAVVVYDLGSSEMVTQMCPVYKLMEDTEKGITVSCSGSKITITGYESLGESTGESDETMVGLDKADFKKAMNEEVEGVTCQ